MRFRWPFEFLQYSLPALALQSVARRMAHRFVQGNKIKSDWFQKSKTDNLQLLVLQAGPTGKESMIRLHLLMSIRRHSWTVAILQPRGHMMHCSCNVLCRCDELQRTNSILQCFCRRAVICNTWTCRWPFSSFTPPVSNNRGHVYFAKDADLFNSCHLAGAVRHLESEFICNSASSVALVLITRKRLVSGSCCWHTVSVDRTSCAANLSGCT
jgi:hypothetical protein